MSDVVFGVYGFDFCHPMRVGTLALTPLYGYPECWNRGEARDELLLTGYGRLPPDVAEAELRAYSSTVRCLADGMTLCQQQRVLVSRLISISSGDSLDALLESKRLPATLMVLESRHTNGALVCHDALFPDSRSCFLDLFLKHVDRATEGDPLSAALYRQIEIWRLSVPYVELEHFLAFSGLEILGRAFGPDCDNRNAAVPIAGLLQSHGFRVSQALVEDWCAARNAVFHRGQLTATAPGSGNLVRVTAQLYELTTLLADCSLKVLGFDDGHINWERWRDHQPFC